MKFVTLFSFLMAVLTLPATVRGADDYFDRLEKEARADFDAFKKLVGEIRKERMILYEGLPHQTWESDLREQELESNRTIEIGGFPFYDVPVEVEAEARTNIFNVLLTPRNFVPYGGPKLCGGYHPDFNLLLRSEQGEVNFQVCFGCHEMKIIRKGDELIMDFNRGTLEALKDVFEAFHSLRPSKTLTGPTSSGRE